VTPGVIGRRYGRALFELAQEGGVTDDAAAGLAELAAAIESLDPAVLAAGSLSVQHREQLGTSLAARVGRDSLLGRFIGVLVASDRLEQLPAIRDSFESLRDKAAGRIRVLVRSSTPLSDAERSQLVEKFEKITGGRVVDRVEVDPELLGGVTVEAEGRVYDGSIRTQLARLERLMAG
jgi:F-type H+-transporting ATPase subunit delta